MLLLKLSVESLGDLFDVERFPQPPGHFDDVDVSLLVEQSAELENDLAEFAEEQIAGLAL